MAARRLTCRELVELVTEYLEGALAPEVHAAVAEHLERCAGCGTYIAQLRSTVDILGSQPPEPLDPAFCDRLIDAFRGWSAGRVVDSDGR